MVGHEYFHNWTGNRITCRDWFQLSLKEGLTVFRDQEFSQDLCGDASARAVKRIEDVRVLRTAQFPEDAGPMAHPVRPDSYIEINNFYTVTIYEKGAEVVRMMQTLVGRDGFAKGMKLYFERHDGQAVTCDDFAQAIADANPGSDLARLLPQFKRWYSQAGTPRVHAAGVYDAAARSYTLTLAQSCAPTPGQAAKEPFVIPVSLGLLGADGADLPLQLDGEAAPWPAPRTFVLTEASQTLHLRQRRRRAGAVHPARLSARRWCWTSTTATRSCCTCWRIDTDPFNRWEAGQRLARAQRYQIHSWRRRSGGGCAPERCLCRRHAQRAAPPHAGRRLQGAGAHPAVAKPTSPSSSTWSTRSASTRCAKPCACSWPPRCRPTGHGPTRRNQDNGAYRPDPLSSGRRALAGMALTMLCLAARDQPATRSGPARPTSASRTPAT